MAKQLNLDLRVQANTQQAKAEFESLQKILFKLQESTKIDIKDESLNKAQKAAGDLARNLQQSVNVDTGKLNLNKFSQSLTKSGQNLKQLHNQLSALGPEGEQAFFKLTQGIAAADASTINLGRKISQLGTALKNTMRWQISSSLLHGFMGAISGAYRYAQDLNESLNNIRIVTGQNIDQMAKFAKEANNAAKALSTTTTEYTDASLIYYQQGLSDEDVKKRTDATIKLANVSRQSAEEVSSQMTAIWNNFADGNDNLEYYEDVITKLGATTASSSQEIAEGLSKFAAVSDTVDLSYEKASAALATVVAETRQSADVVGTAFKTMFARLEGLQLGETLEDGVDLNKYSKALEAIGVNILDMNGQIKSMDDILDETGEKWQNIGKEQQIALAQTVAGVRQYTQFISLMDNYDKVQKNENVAKSSAGTVDEQAETYAESWEAAKDRVTAALEEIYKQLLNDEAFISILNGLEKFIEFISNIIDGLGGVKGLLLMISSIFMQHYAKEMPRVLETLRENIDTFTGASAKRAANVLKEAREELEKPDLSININNKEMEALQKTSITTAKMTEALNAARKNLSQTEIEAYQREIDLAKAMGQTTEALGKEIDAMEKAGKVIVNKMNRGFRKNGADKTTKDILSHENEQTALDEIDKKYKINEEKITKLEERKKELEEDINNLQQKDTLTKDESKALTDNKEEKEKVNKEIEEELEIQEKKKKAREKEKDDIKKYYNDLRQYSGKTGKQLLADLEKEIKAYGRKNAIIIDSQRKVESWEQAYNRAGKNNTKSNNELVKQMEQYTNKLREAGINVNGLTDAITAFKTGNGSIEKIIDAFKNLDSTLDESDNKIETIKQNLRLLGASDEDLKELSRIWEQAGADSEEYKAKLQEIIDKTEEVPQKTIKVSEGLTQMASAAMQVATVINSIQNIGKIFSDEDLSAGEKFIQVMTAIGSVIPMIIALLNKQRIVEMGAVAAKILHIGATKADAAAEEESIGAKIASGNAGWYALGPLLLFVAIAAAAIALIVAITMALISLANAETDQEKAARLANEELERSKKAAEEAKQAYEDLKSKVSDYNSAIEALEQCTKGTQEWRDAFKEVLAQASALIEAYPQLLKYKTLYNKDGTLNQDVLEKAVEQAQQTAINASNVQMLNSVRVSAANQDLDLSNTIKQLRNTESLHKYITETSEEKNRYPWEQKRTNELERESKTFTDANKKTISAEDLMENISKEAIQQNIDFANKDVVSKFVEERLKGLSTTDFEDIDDASSVITEALTSTSEELQKLGNETDNLATQMFNAAKVIFDNYFADKDFKDTNEEIAYQQAYEEASAKVTQELRQGVVAAHTGSFDVGKSQTSGTMDKGHSSYGGQKWDTQAYEKLINAYATKNGLTLDKDNHHGVEWRDGDAYVKFVGQKKDDEKTIEEIYSEMLPQFLEEEREKIEKNAKEIYSKMDKDTDAVEYFKAKGDFNEVSYNEMQKNIFDSKGKVKSFDVLFEDENELREAVAKKLNISAEEVTESQIKEVEEKYNNEVQGALNSLKEVPKQMKETFGEDLINNIDIGSLKAVSDMYTKTLLGGGQEGIEFLESIIQESGDEAADVLSTLANMDLENMDTKKVNAALKDLGVSCKLTESQVYSLKNYLTKAAEATTEVAQETYKTISSIVSKIKQEGDIVEDEDYQKLLALNPAIDSFFTTLADGTHMLTGEVQDFKTAMQTATTNEFYQAIQNKENAAQAYDYLSKAQTYSSETMIKSFNDKGNSVKYNAETGKYELTDEQKKGSDIYEQNKEQTLAYINILKDRGDQEAALYEEQIAKGENLNEIALKVADSVDKLKLSTEDYAQAAEDAANENVKLIEAMKESAYQNEITNANLDYETTENYANTLMDLYEAEGLTKEGARALAIANQRLDRGLSSLNDNFEDWKESLEKTNKASAEYAETIGEIRDAFADLLNIADTDELSLSWIESWAKDSDKMEKILDGDTETLQEFRESAFSEMTTNVFEDVKNSAQDLFDTLDGKDSKTSSILEDLINQLENGKISAEGLKEELDNIGSTEIGTDASLSQEYTDALNTMLAEGLMTEQQLNDIFASIGYKPKMTVKSVRQEVQVPNYKTIEHITEEPKNENGEYTRTVWTETEELPDSPKIMSEYVPVAQIESADNATGNIEIVNAGSENITPSYSSTSSGKSSDSSSSDSSSKNTSAASHTHEVNRYSDEENAINGLTEQYERLGKAKDQAFGAGTIQAMELELKKLKELKNASSNYLEAIVGNGNAEKVAQTLYSGGSISSLISSGQLGGTIASDYKALFNGTSASGKNVEYTAKDSDGNEWLASTNYSINDFASMFGSSINFQLDSYGNITNKDSILNELQRLTNQENSNYAQYSDPTAASTTEHNKRIAYLEEIKERIEQYGTTVEDLSTQADAYLDYISEIQEKNAEIISTKLENGISLSNNTLTRLERALKILGDDIYKSTEKIMTWFDTKLNSNQEEYRKQAKLNADAFTEIQEKVELYKENPLDENAISPAKAAELAEEIAENYATLYEKSISDIAEMEGEYEGILNDWKEEIAEVTTSIDFNIEKLSHLRKVFELLGKSADYNSLEKFLKAQASGAEEKYKDTKREADKARELYSAHEAYANGLKGKEREEYEKTILEKDRALLQEWEKEEQSSFQSWIEVLQEVHENNINKIYQQFEDNLTGEYGSFSNLDASMERQKSITEEYLTKTNQLYETNKMLRNLQKDIDKTDNRMAKDKLKAFSNEINSMKEKEKLTKTDLELAKAKYEILKAQIALEEAQNAKSTVRLQRDNEGNYGYVYTADQDKISDAEQDLADKENAYYNLALQQANDFSQKLAQIGQEYMEARKQLEQERDEGLISEEQYQQSLIELQDYYKDLELRYLEGYNTAAGVLDEEAATSRIEAWGASYEDILDKQRLFNDDSIGAAQELNSQLQAETQDWQSTQQSLLQEAGLDNKNYQQTVNDVTKEINKLGQQITKNGGLVDQFGSAASITEKLTRDFVNQYEALLNEANGYLQLSNDVNLYRESLAELTNQQLQYNAALAAQPSAVYSGNNSGGYGNNGNNSSYYDSNTDPNIEKKAQNKNKTSKEAYYRIEDKDGRWFYVPESQVARYQRDKNYSVSKLKSGGYTGTWSTSGKTGLYTGSWNGPDLEENGKLAFLHQKELVLNATDTENMLNAVKLIRQISQTIDLQAATQSSAFQMQAAQFSNNGQVLQQEVTIHAEFPNAKDHNEIEEAFNNLVNKASQYANREQF